MVEKETIEQELKKLMEIREAMFKHFDDILPKDEITGAYDFSSSPKIEASEIYKHCFKLDYQARKIRAFLVTNYGLKP